MTKRTDVRIEELAFLRALGEVMAGDLRADKALARAVDLCFVRFELGALCAFRVDEGVFRLVAAHGLDREAWVRLERLPSRELSAILGNGVFALAHEMGMTDACTALSRTSERDAPRSAIFAPLVYARRRLGALLVIGHEGDHFGPHSRTTWEPVVDTISVALRAADDFERVVALEAEKRQLVDNLPLIVARFDARGEALTFVNAAVQRVLGLRAADVGAARLEQALADDTERDASRAARDRAASGRPSPWEDRRYRHADGRILTMRECVYPVFDAARAVQAIEVIAYDISGELEARKELMRADRLATLGALAAGVAHEINNPVAVISLAVPQMAKLLRRIEGGDPHAAKNLEGVLHEVDESATRIGQIVGELKLFTRIGEADVACPVDVNRILETALALASNELKKHARLEVSMSPLPVAPGSFVNLGHAFVNLFLNAAQAIESRILTGERGASASHVIRVTSEQRGDFIVVAVEDTGIGIDPKLLPRIFDPFFKADSGASGAGLGLAIAYDLVRRVGGHIRVESKPMHGARFVVELPLAELGAPPSAERELVPRTRERGPGASLPRVLVIDDERALVRALARQLSDQYDVDTAATARDALAQLSLHSYDVIVCDLRMPDQSGSQIYEEVRARSAQQAARFVFTTGGSYGTEDDEMHRRVDATGLPVLEKPFDGVSFEAVVARVAAQPWGDDAPREVLLEA